MRTAFVATLAVLCLSDPTAIAAQVRADPGVVVGGRIAVHIAVTLRDDAEPDYLVRGLPLRVTRSEGAADSVMLITDAAGVATVLLAPGAYRLATVRPVDWKSRWYRWDLAVVVRAGMKRIELTNANAAPPGGTPLTVITGRPPSEPARSTARTASATAAPAPRSSSTSQGERSSFRLLSGSIGFVHTPEDEGLSMSFGLGGVLKRRLVGFLFPLDLALVPNKDSRYYTDRFDNGNSVCRDTDTGRFADKGNCAADVIYAASAEGGFALTSGQHPVYVTGGYRIGAGETGFGAVAVAFQPLAGLHWYGRASIGRDFAQVVLGGSIPW